MVAVNYAKYIRVGERPAIAVALGSNFVWPPQWVDPDPDPPSQWLIFNGEWRDSGEWVDTEIWQDG